MIIIVTAMVQCPFLAGKMISLFNVIVNEIVVNLAINSLKQFHTSISLNKIMLNSSLNLCCFFETLIFVSYFSINFRSL